MQIFIENNNESYAPPSEGSFKMHDKTEKKQILLKKIQKPDIAQDAATKQDKADST